MKCGDLEKSFTLTTATNVMINRIKPIGILEVLLTVLLFLANNSQSEEVKQPARIQELKAAAEKGDAAAQFSLGLKFYYAQGLPQNYDEAAQWFTKSAAQGNALAQLNLGVCYYQGQGVPKDDKKAAELFRHLAENGDADAQSLLGLLYTNGEGVPYDDVESFKWFSLAASQGQEDAVKGREAVKDKLDKEQIVEAEKRIQEFLAKKATPSKLLSPRTDIKAFDELFFGEEKSVVERKQKKTVKIGEMNFELTCGYEKIGGKELLSDVFLKASWTDVDEQVIKANLEAVKQILSEKFGKPTWAIKKDEDTSAEENNPSLKYQWKIGEEKVVNVLRAIKRYNTEHKEKVDSLAGKLLGREYTVTDSHQEHFILIGITSLAIEKIKVKESATPF